MTQRRSIKESVIQTLTACLPEIQERFGVETLALFGSVSRGEDTESSDIDILYRFHDGVRMYRSLLGLADYLENLFGREVDLVSADWIDPPIRPYIEKDVIVFLGNIRERPGVRDGLYPPVKSEA